MKTKIKKIVALIPCHNEAEGVGKVVQGFFEEVKKNTGYSLEVIVIDNNSSDATAQVAQDAGAIVIHEEKVGKGNAIKKGFESVPHDTDYVVMIDGDDTYQSHELFRLIEPLRSHFCNVVIGSRLTGKIAEGAMSSFNRFGNWMFSFLVRFFYNANVTDVLTGYFAWNYQALMRLHPHLVARDFGIEMDMVTKMAILGESISCVPITYRYRSGVSNLRPVSDGVRILMVFVRNLFWKSDMSYVVFTPKLFKS
ncbi:MAG: hypothetical protein UU89_C0040G0004 [Parcubacteria group bacterium GW2011_GWC2_42_11]|nr:MAG: hypothetical protein UU89_C0040G0004 [Parcubacteria group bacterium GW2011_GWC2_42_11]